MPIERGGALRLVKRFNKSLECLFITRTSENRKEIQSHSHKMVWDDHPEAVIPLPFDFYYRSSHEQIPIYFRVGII